MHKAVRFVKDWMLPLAIVLGISLYLIYHYTPALHGAGHWLHIACSEGQRLVIAVLLFFQFVKVSPHDLHVSHWHLGALLVQVVSFLLLAGAVALVPAGDVRMLLECAMLCMICPTASAAGVITDRLGGNLAGTVTYLVMINLAATFLIPLVIPLVNPSQDMGFWTYVGHLALKVFPVLIVPGLLAWLIRYTTHRLQRRLMRWSAHSFYVWGVGLTLAMVMSTRALMLSHLQAGAIAGIVLVSMACCALQFVAGRRLGRKDTPAGPHIGREGAVPTAVPVAEPPAGTSSASPDSITAGQALEQKETTAGPDSITAGQALGQKNTGFLIWLGYNYMTPVTSVAGGLYAIWQNLFNSWELYQKQHPGKTPQAD
jgi:BASS family bile acid:Na+ symporter